MTAEQQRNLVAERLAELRAKLDAAQSRIAELERTVKHTGDGAKARTAKVANLRRALRQFMRAKEAHIAEMLAELGDRRRLLQEVGRARKRVAELELEAQDETAIAEERIAYCKKLLTVILDNAQYSSSHVGYAMIPTYVLDEPKLMLRGKQ